MLDRKFNVRYTNMEFTQIELEYNKASEAFVSAMRNKSSEAVRLNARAAFDRALTEYEKVQKNRLGGMNVLQTERY